MEAVRLGCEVTAIDINPVAWFILKCTLEYPQKPAGQKRLLPEFILTDEEFMERSRYCDQMVNLGAAATEFQPQVVRHD
ncbi:MAG: hypothetical protein AB1374_09835 [Bacillota bacterium]